MNEGGVRLAIFDCDGTLVDSLAAIHASVAAAARALGRSEPTSDAVQTVVGLALETALGKLFGEDADLDAARDAYVVAYRDLIADPSLLEPLYEGAVAALDALDGRGVLLGVATGKGRRGLEAVLDRHGLRDRFVTLKTSDDGPGKPSPEILLQAMAEAGAEPADTVMIGDTTYDMLMAHNAGVHAVGVTWGYHARDALSAAGAHRLVRRFAEVPPTIERLTGDGTCGS